MLAILKTVKEYDLSFTEEYYLERLLGHDDKGALKKLFSDHGLETNLDTIKKLIATKNQEFLNIVATQLVFFDGVLDFLAHLDALLIPYGIVSGAMSQEIIPCLQQGNIFEKFRFVIGADHVSHSKPEPDCYELGFEKMQALIPELTKPACWVLEDSAGGISAAKKAGLPTIGITNSLASEYLQQADFVVDHYQEIKLV